MKAINRYGYRMEDVFSIKQWINADEHKIEDISYYQLKGTIVVQLFDKGVYIGCAVTTDDYSTILPLGWLDRCIRFKINDKISAIPLSTFKQKNNGEPYDETIN